MHISMPSVYIYIEQEKQSTRIRWARLTLGLVAIGDQSQIQRITPLCNMTVKYNFPKGEEKGRVRVKEHC